MSSEAIQTANGTFCPAARRRYVLIAAILASALGFIDGSILAIALPDIRLALGASFAQAQWISNAYALTLSALILVGGAAGDTFGLRRSFAIGIAAFVAASLLCAIAPTPNLLIGFRALQGIGAALMVPGSLAIIAKAYPKGERGNAIGIWAASSALTTAIGPVLGGILLEWGGPSIWRFIFAINLPLGAVALYLLLAKIPADRPEKARHLDLGGAVLAVLSLGGISYGLTALGSDGAGSSPVMVGATISIGLLLLAAFVLFERRLGREAMMDLRLFAIGQFTGANIATFFLYFALSAVLFYLPMLLIAGWGMTTTEAGFTFLPLSVLIALMSKSVGRFSDRLGARLPIALGSLVVALAFAALALVAQFDIRSFWLAVFPAMVAMGFGMALVVSPLSTAIMTAVDDRDTGAASGINNAGSRIAGLFAVAAMGTLAAWLYGQGGLSAGIPGFGEPPQAAALDAAAEAVRIGASNRAFAGVAWFSAALSAASAVTAWLTIAGDERKT
jgi:EmrB/QacA subfamily drug resistance transporter